MRREVLDIRSHGLKLPGMKRTSLMRRLAPPVALGATSVAALLWWGREDLGRHIPAAERVLQQIHNALTGGAGEATAPPFAGDRAGTYPSETAKGAEPAGLGRGPANPAPNRSPANVERQESPEVRARRAPAEMRSRGEAITRLKDDRKALGEAFLELSADLTKENWREAFEGVSPVYGKGLLPKDGWENFMRQIGRLAGAEVLEKFRPHDPLMYYEGYGSRFAMEGWTRSEPAAARSYLESLPDGRFKDGLAMGMFSAMTTNDRPGLERLFKELPEAYYPQIATALREKVRWEQPQGIPAVQHWLTAAEATYGRDSAAWRAIQQAAQVDLLEHAEYDKNSGLAVQTAADVFANHSQYTDRVLDMSLRVLADSQPAQAFQYLEQHVGSRPQLAGNLPEMIGRWAEQDLGGPGDWLNAHKNSALYAPGVQAYAKLLAKENPAAAQQWLSTLRTSR
jgi:hypothetical protein